MAERAPSNRRTTAVGCLVAVATLALMLATEPRLAIVWDEGYTLGREARIRSWFQALRDPAHFAASWQPPQLELVQPDIYRPPLRAEEVDSRAKLLRHPTLDWFWPFAREEPHGHPPFYALVGLIGDVLAPDWAILPRARLGPMLVFSLTAGALFSFMARRRGCWPGALTAGAWVLQPRLFAHGHYAHYDGLLSSLWVLSILAFAQAVEPGAHPAARTPRWGWVVLFGLLAGSAAATKLTGWFLPLPFLVWTLLYRDRRGALTWLVGGLVAVATLYALLPPWWSDPILGVDRFLRSNLGRVQSINISVLFLGQVILTPRDSLPWYNTLVWTVFVTPVGFLALALVGAVRAVGKSRSQPFGMLALGHWGMLLILRALPHTPGHDGVRLFLPAFGCLALVAGWGSAWLVERFGRWGRAAIVAALAEGAISLAMMMPVPLSYYSPLVGGLPGATALGMEPTYYWDALGPDALAWLNRHTGPGQRVVFSDYPTSLVYLRKVGKLTMPILPGEPGALTWYVIQNRSSSFTRRDRALIQRLGPRHVLVEKFGVPLIWAFPFSERLAEGLTD